MSGPSGSGKTTLHKRLIFSRRFKGKLVKSLSATTRPKRIGEKHGRDYLFLSKKKFDALRKKNKFLEWQKVFDSYYGTLRSVVEKLLKQGFNVLLCIDVKGARVVHRQFPGCVRIFIKTPSLKILKQRLEKRGTESVEDLKLRLSIAKDELQEERKYDYVIVNNHFTHAYKRLESIMGLELKKGK